MNDETIFFFFWEISFGEGAQEAPDIKFTYANFIELK